MKKCAMKIKRKKIRMLHANLLEGSECRSKFLKEKVTTLLSEIWIHYSLKVLANLFA